MLLSNYPKNTAEMYNLRSLVILVCFIEGLLGQQDRAVNNELQCYVCAESMTQACRDPIDIKYLEKHPCNSLDYGHQQPRRAAGVEGTLLVPVTNPLLRDIFGTREGFPNRITFEYECIKFVENDGVERSCVPKPVSIDTNACDYFKKEKPTLKSCYSCRTDDCNGSSTIGLSLIGIFVTLFVLLRLY